MERSCKKLSADGISSLPGSIIDSILARLPLREAVRTSILSREWRYKWTSVPNLVFDSQVDPISKLKNIIYQVLHHHRGPINTFSLRCTTSPDIDQWILLLSSSQVQDFTLRILLRGDKHGMTSPFFAFQNLKHLYLYRCIFNPPPEFKGFSKLATLDFHNVDFVPAKFEKFISRSPLLKRVMLVSCTELDAFEVQGPSLRVFTLYGVFKTICFKKSPVLAEVSLSMPIEQNWGIRSSIGFNCFHIPPMLEKLQLQPCILKLPDAGAVPSRFTDSLNSLKVLNLTMCLDSIKEVACALCLARSSPNLQMLRIYSHAHRNEEAVIEFIRAQETPDPYLNQLRRVEIALCSSYETEIELLRYLLASTAELEEMVITPYYSSLSDKVINRLKQFHQASPTALVFENRGGICCCLWVAFFHHRCKFNIVDPSILHDIMIGGKSLLQGST